MLTEFEHADDIIVAVRDLQDPMKCLMKVLPTKSALIDECAPIEAQKGDESLMASIDVLHAEAIKSFMARMSILRQNTTKAYNLIWRECSPALQSELRGHTERKQNYYSSDCVWLLKTVSLLSAEVDNKPYVLGYDPTGILNRLWLGSSPLIKAKGAYQRESPPRHRSHVPDHCTNRQRSHPPPRPLAERLHAELP